MANIHLKRDKNRNGQKIAYLKVHSSYM